jgi:hypothetical protein
VQTSSAGKRWREMEREKQRERERKRKIIVHHSMTGAWNITSLSLLNTHIYNRIACILT